MSASRARARLRRYIPEVLGALGGVAFGLVFIFVTRPANFLPEIVIVSGPTCGKSEKLVRSIVADSELQRVFTPLSVSDDADDSTAASACDVAYEHVIAHAPWFRIAGRDWVCARLTESARRYRDEAHGFLPVWVHDGVIVDVEERDRLLLLAGYHLLPAGDGVVLRTEASGIVDQAAPPPAASSEWRGQSIGF